MSTVPAETEDGSVAVEVRVAPELLEHLDAVAAEVGRDRAGVIEDMLVDYLDDMALARIAEERMEGILAGREVTVPHPARS